MKNSKMVFIVGILVSTITTKTTAQFFTSNAGNPQKESYAIAGNNGKVDYKNTAKANSRALKDFNSTFKTEPAVKWFREKNVIVATFTRDDINTHVVYNKQGKRIRTMKEYRENNMPEDLRVLVKRSIYFDYGITFVQQIEEDGITVCFVHLKYGKKYKQISVYEGEINVIMEYDLQ